MRGSQSMDWTTLYTMQEKLDTYIEENHELSPGKRFEERLLAFLVELGELANETRCFKFWSKEGRSSREDILEEYVDGLHFLLSLGLQKGYSFSGTEITSTSLSETEQFLEIFSNGIAFQKESNVENYEKLFISFMQLGNLLGFQEQEIQGAYQDKNKVNFQRQDDGY